MRRVFFIVVLVLWVSGALLTLLNLVVNPRPDAPLAVDIAQIESGEFAEGGAWIELKSLHFGARGPVQISRRIAERGVAEEVSRSMFYFSVGSAPEIADRRPRMIVRMRPEQFPEPGDSTVSFTGVTYVSGAKGSLPKYITDRHPETLEDTLILTVGEKPMGLVGSLFLLAFYSAIALLVLSALRPPRREFLPFEEDEAYLDRDEASRREFLAGRSDDFLIMRARDLDYLDLSCEVLDAELERRGIAWRGDKEYALPPEYLERKRVERRLPNRWEYGWKFAQFHGVRIAPIATMFVVVGFAVFKTPLEYLLAAGALWVIPMFACWFSPFFYPLRYTLVRPFNDRQFSKPLQRFVRRHIGLRCHGFTLSDRNFRPSRAISTMHALRLPLAFVAILMGAAINTFATIVGLASVWICQSVRLLTVVAPSGSIAVLETLNQRRRLNGRHLFCGGQCFNIRTVNEAWKYSIQALFEASDFVIVDLSQVRAGSDWEISRLEGAERIGRGIAVCQVGCEDAVERYAHLFDEVLRYDRKGRIVGGGDMSVEERIRKATG